MPPGGRGPLATPRPRRRQHHGRARAACHPLAACRIAAMERGPPTEGRAPTPAAAVKGGTATAREARRASTAAPR
eukprot:13431510-Alexandrium_andersonii.AAC.1